MDRHIRKERFISRLIRSPFSYVVLIVFILIFSISAVGTYKKSRIAKQKTKQVEAQFQSLVEQEAHLKSSLEDMNTEYGMEKALREKFGIVKEGEVSVIIVDPKEEEKVDDKKEKGGLFNFIKRIF
ncbi:MAG: hypothetical protein QG551_243 [Patescibacteria group bacterium]|jgi:cell division protein FtsB|nr:hypothetical protein [Patescibacteria group bacterium]